MNSPDSGGEARNAPISADNASAPGEGERRAQRGYTHQYDASAAAIYGGLIRGDLRWIGLADRGAGIADDVVLGYDAVAVGHQFKFSLKPEAFRLKTLFGGANGLLPALIVSWRRLRASCPGLAIRIKVIVSDRPSSNDVLGTGGGTSEEFVGDWRSNPDNTLQQWRQSRWKAFIEELATESGLDEAEFQTFWQGLELTHGGHPSFQQQYGLRPESQPLVERISSILPRLVAKVPSKDRWTKDEFLSELGWPDIVAKHSHRFPLGVGVQRNPNTEAALRAAIHSVESGYLSLIGPPGTGKSTLLQSALEAEARLQVVRYLAFVPDGTQGIGRAEATSFHTDLIASLRNSGLQITRLRHQSPQELREEFEGLLHAASARYKAQSVTTLIVIDGLDHVPREEQPDRSFLNELPLPTAVPQGVIFVLGTQRVDLPGVPVAVVEQASETARRTVMAPLPLPAIAAMAETLGAPPEVPRGRIYEAAQGHPLATRYLIEALKAADSDGRSALIDGGFEYSGDIERVYRSAWRGIEHDADALNVLDIVVRAECQIPPQAIAQIIPPTSVETAWAKTSHLLAVQPDGWSVFHNSFRLFVLRQKRMRFGQVDPGHSAGVYCKLLQIARLSPEGTVLREMELRYLMRAGIHREVIERATPAHFRRQFLDGRPVRQIQDDIRLAFHSLTQVVDATAIFGLLLASDEIWRRVTAQEEAPELVTALIALGELEAAEQHTQDIGGDSYAVIGAWLLAGKLERARNLFERVEPLHDLSLDALTGHEAFSEDGDLAQWAKLAPNFRTVPEIASAIDRIVAVAQRAENRMVEPGELGTFLRETAAFGAIAVDLSANTSQLVAELGLPESNAATLLLAVGTAQLEKGDYRLGELSLSRALASSSAIAESHRGVRRRAALAAARQGLVTIAGQLLDPATPPAISELDEEYGRNAVPHLVRAVIEHSELVHLLSATPQQVNVPRHAMLRPLQRFAEATGELAARSRSTPVGVHSGQVVRECTNVLTYVIRSQAMGGGDYLAVSQLQAAAPTIIHSLLRSASRTSQSELEAVIEAIDRTVVDHRGSARFAEIDFEVARIQAQISGKADAAEHRLDSLTETLDGNTPAAYLGDAARVARAYADIGRRHRGLELFGRLRNETLGYSLPAKKDPQYSIWRELLVRANSVDPSQRRQRVVALARQATGMARTEGQDSAYRIADAVIAEASMASPTLGWQIASQLLKAGLTSLAAVMNAVLIGSLTRSPDLLRTWARVWNAICLPYYRENYYRSSKVGEFIRSAVARCPEDRLQELIAEFAQSAEVHAQVDVRPALINALAEAAAQRNAESPVLQRTEVRVAAEVQMPTHGGSSPQKYDDVTSMSELRERLSARDDGETIGYEASSAFERLVETAPLDVAMEVFNGHETIQKSNRARFGLVERALALGQAAIAKGFVAGYEMSADESATWSSWMGGGRARYFGARKVLEGDAVCSDAYADFASSVAGGRENVSAVLSDVEDIWPLITKAPDWPAMWALVQEQLATTRDHQLGHDAEKAEDLVDLGLAAVLLEAFLVLPLSDTQWHGFRGAVQVAEVDPKVSVKLCMRLCDASLEATLLGLQLALACEIRVDGDAGLVDRVAILADSGDLGVRQLAHRLLRRWGQPAISRRADLPIIYALELPEEPDGQRELIKDSEYGPPLVSDAQAWCGPFESLIRELSRSGVSPAHIRLRVQQLVDSWGGLEAFGKPATDRLHARLGLLDLKMPYRYPHIIGASRALRVVAGELERAGRVPAKVVATILDRLGVPIGGFAGIIASRPEIIRQPALPPSYWQDKEGEEWLDGVRDDAEPVQSADWVVLAEVTRYHYRSTSETSEWLRCRIPQMTFKQGASPFEGYRELPFVLLREGSPSGPVGEWPAMVCRVIRSALPQVPDFELTLNDLLATDLEWSRVGADGRDWEDSEGQLMACTVSWRDGGQDGDAYHDCLWGEGSVVMLTPPGWERLRAIAGTLSIGVSAQRESKRGEKVKSRVTTGEYALR